MRKQGFKLHAVAVTEIKERIWDHPGSRTELLRDRCGERSEEVRLKLPLGLGHGD